MSTEQTEQQIPTNGGAPVINTPPEEQTIMTPIDTLLASAPTSLSIEGVGIDPDNLDPTDYFDVDGYVRHCINCISESYEHTTYTDVETTIDGGDLGELDIRLDEVEVEIEIDLEEAVGNSYCGTPPSPDEYFDVSELRSSGEVTCKEFFAAHTAKTEDPRVLVLQAIEYMVEQRTGRMVPLERYTADCESRDATAAELRQQLGSMSQQLDAAEALSTDLEWALTVLATLQVSDEVRQRAAAANCTLVAALQHLTKPTPDESQALSESGQSETETEGVITPADWTSPNTVDTNTEEA